MKLSSLQEHAVSAAPDVGKVARLIVGDPTFLGPFVVRYADSKQWDARIAAAGDFTQTPPDYVRNIAFHAFVLVSMSHETVSLFARVASTMAQSLSRMSKLGGFKGAGDLYTFLFVRAQPLYTVLSSAAVGASPAVVGATRELEDAMRAVSAPLARRLGWATDVADVSRGSGGSVPWPSHEDSGIEARAWRTLRPVALLQAVLYADRTTIDEALALFRKAVAANNSSAFSAAGARAAFVAAARYGTDADYQALYQIWATEPKGSPRRADALFAISAGAADDERCRAGLHVVGTLATAKERLTTLVDVLNFALHCRDVAWAAYVAVARELWLEEGADATVAITAGLAALSSVSELHAATELLGQQNSTLVDADAAHQALTRVRANIDMVEFNSVGAVQERFSDLSLFI